MSPARTQGGTTEAPLTIVTSCFGERFWSALPQWARHLREFAEFPIDVVALDDRAHDFDPGANIEILNAPTAAEELEYGAGDLPRLRRIVDHLRAGKSCAQVDIDVRLRKNIQHLLDLPYPVIISRAAIYPPVVAAEFGFVCCTGFFIMKPDALAFCEGLIEKLAAGQWETSQDQFVLNMMLYENRASLSWREAEIAIDGVTVDYTVIKYEGVEICVLGSNVVARQGGLEQSLFGLHNRDVIEYFRPTPPRDAHAATEVRETAPSRSGIIADALVGSWKRSWLRHMWRRRIKKGYVGKTPEWVFNEIYRRNMWDCRESRSGWGSTVDATKNVAAALPNVLSALEIRRFLDAPCGDFNWFRHVQLPGNLEYIGIDIVEHLIEGNRARYENGWRKFLVLDVIADPLPSADILFCRDCLIHFSYADVFKFLSNFIGTDIPYLMTTTYGPPVSNRDITTGDYRPIDLFAPPFSFPQEALLRIDDTAPGGPPRLMCVWEKAQIAEILARRPGNSPRPTHSPSTRNPR